MLRIDWFFINNAYIYINIYIYRVYWTRCVKSSSAYFKAAQYINIYCRFFFFIIKAFGCEPWTPNRSNIYSAFIISSLSWRAKKSSEKDDDYLDYENISHTWAARAHRTALVPFPVPPISVLVYEKRQNRKAATIQRGLCEAFSRIRLQTEMETSDRLQSIKLPSQLFRCWLTRVFASDWLTAFTWGHTLTQTKVRADVLGATKAKWHPNPPATTIRKWIKQECRCLRVTLVYCVSFGTRFSYAYQFRSKFLGWFWPGLPSYLSYL